MVYRFRIADTEEGVGVAAWLRPSGELSEPARVYRGLWADRWPDWDPKYLGGGAVPDGAVRGRRDAYPLFRCPLSADEVLQISGEFHHAVVSRLAGGEPLTVVTFDYELTFAGEIEYRRFDTVPDLDRDPWLSLTEEPEDDDPDPPTITHLFHTELTPTDPRLAVILARAAVGDSPVTITDRNLNWIAIPHEETMTVISYDPKDLDVLVEAQQATRARWGVDQPFAALIDLAEVTAYFNERRASWARAGVQVVAGPEYRTWTNDGLGVTHDLPDDLGTVDWFRIELETLTSRATIVVHDTGTCSVSIDIDVENPDDPEDIEYEILNQAAQHAGHLDLPGVLATMERVATAIAHRNGSSDAARRQDPASPMS